MTHTRPFLQISLLIGFTLAACSPATTAAPIAGTPGTGIATSEPSLVTVAEAASETPNPDFSPTPDTRLKPEQWQDWPIIPVLSPRAAQIYARGISQGNDLHAFSKVGDCQSIPEAFLGIYDKPGQYDLTDQYQSLQETIDWYRGSWGRESQSVRGGFNAASVLLPLWADPTACNSGETPLECEFRLHKPSIVIISLEVWFKGRTPDTLAGYLRQIIDFAISKNVLPVLVTKADNVEGDNSINLTVAKLAYEYDLPLWNFWRAVQPLTDHGIDWARDPQGFHITVAAWNMRSFTALQTLDSLRRELSITSAATPAVASMHTDTTPDPGFSPAALTAFPFATVSPFTTGNAEMPGIIFELQSRGLDVTQKLGIFSGNLSGNNWASLASPGFSLLDLSADGKQALLRYASNLYLLDLTDPKPRLLSDHLVGTPLQPAYFVDNERVAAILMEGNVGLYLLTLQGSQRVQLKTGSADPLELVPSHFNAKVYWYTGACDSSMDCKPDKLYVSPADGGNVETVPNPGRLRVSPDGTLAFVQSSDTTWNYLTLVKGAETHSLWVPGNRLIDMAWSADGSTLALSTVTVSTYSGKIQRNYHTLVKWPAVMQNMDLSEGKVTERLLWAPDGNSLLVMRRDISGTDNILNFNLVDAATFNVLDGGFSIKSGSYLVLPALFWQGAAH